MSKWVAKNEPITYPEMLNNAKIVTMAFINLGATHYAVAALLGNMQAESGINPGAWENYEPYEGGYGLVQWTPYTNYSQWWGAGWENNGDAQIRRIIYEIENGLQWIETDEYPISFIEWLKSTDNVRYLADAFMKNYERPADQNQPWRGDYAEAWFKVIKGAIPTWYWIVNNPHDLKENLTRRCPNGTIK